MDLTAEMSCAATPVEVFPLIDDLGCYPQWMGLVHKAEPLDPIDGRAAWKVELRAKVGPFARSKRLTMIRSHRDEPRQVTFERCDDDGREHSMWRLRATINPGDEGSTLLMNLHYGGNLWTGGIVDKVLHDEITRSRARLATLLVDSRH